MRTALSNPFTGSVLAFILAAAAPIVFAQQGSPATQDGSRLGTYGGIWGGGGAGTLDGYATSRGTMGPGMIGPGMDGRFGFGPLGALNLSADQQRTITHIQDNLRKHHWSLLGQIHDQQAALRDLYAADRADPKQIGDAYEKIGQLQREMAESHARALNDIRGTLTPEQREQLAQLQRRGFRGHAFGAPGTGGMMGW